MIITKIPDYSSRIANIIKYPSSISTELQLRLSNNTSLKYAGGSYNLLGIPTSRYILSIPISSTDYINYNLLGVDDVKFGHQDLYVISSHISKTSNCRLFDTNDNITNVNILQDKLLYTEGISKYLSNKHKHETHCKSIYNVFLSTILQTVESESLRQNVRLDSTILNRLYMESRYITKPFSDIFNSIYIYKLHQQILNVSQILNEKIERVLVTCLDLANHTELKKYNNTITHFTELTGLDLLVSRDNAVQLYGTKFGRKLGITGTLSSKDISYLTYAGNLHYTEHTGYDNKIINLLKTSQYVLYGHDTQIQTRLCPQLSSMYTDMCDTFRNKTIHASNEDVFNFENTHNVHYTDVDMSLVVDSVLSSIDSHLIAMFQFTQYTSAPFYTMMMDMFGVNIYEQTHLNILKYELYINDNVAVLKLYILTGIDTLTVSIVYDFVLLDVIDTSLIFN